LEMQFFFSIFAWSKL